MRSALYYLIVRFRYLILLEKKSFVTFVRIFYFSHKTKKKTFYKKKIC